MKFESCIDIATSVYHFTGDALDPYPVRILSFRVDNRLERLISALILVVPAAIGVVFGILSLRHREPKPWIAVAGILLNGAFALFNVLVLAFAG